MGTEWKTQKYVQPSLRTYTSPPSCQDAATKEKRHKQGRNPTKEQKRQRAPTRRNAQRENTRNIPQTKNSEKGEPQPILQACRIIELTPDTPRQEKEKLKSPGHMADERQHAKDKTSETQHEKHTQLQRIRREAIIVEGNTRTKRWRRKRRETR